MNRNAAIDQGPRSQLSLSLRLLLLSLQLSEPSRFCEDDCPDLG